MAAVKTWKVRIEKGITLKELSQMSGISKTCLNDIENNKTSPTINELEKIAKALNVRMTDLFESKYK